MGEATSASGHADRDVAAVAALLADRARARVLLALLDGRALPASVLAQEAGVAPSTMSGHLARLCGAGWLVVRPQGRHRYYALAGPQVAELVETLGALAPALEVRSLRQGTRAAALRAARTCYDHLAGRLGSDLMAAMLADGWLDGGDGRHRDGGPDRLAAPGHDVRYDLTDAGAAALHRIGVDVGPPATVAVRYCVDWTEQRHHLAGSLGRAVTARLLELGRLRRQPRGRAVQVTDAGSTALPRTFPALRLAPGPGTAVEVRA